MAARESLELDEPLLSNGDFLVSANREWSLTVTPTGVVKHNQTTGETLCILPADAALTLEITADGVFRASLPDNLNPLFATEMREGYSSVVLGDDGQLMLKSMDAAKAPLPISTLLRAIPPHLESLVGRGLRVRLRGFVQRYWRGIGAGGAALAVGALIVWFGFFDSDRGVDWVSPGNINVLAAFLFVLSVCCFALIAYGLNPDEESTGAWLQPLLWAAVPVILYLILWWLILGPGTAVTDEVQREARAQLFAVVSVAFTVVVTGLLFRRSRKNADAPVSLVNVMSTNTSAAPTVLLLWTLVVVYGVALIAGYRLLAGGSFDCGDKFCADPTNWYEYLILLGVPGAAAALSKKQADGPPAVDPSTQNTNAVAEVQYFVFNAIAMVFVMASLLNDGELPAIPPVILALTGASALVYTIDKRAPAADPRAGQ